MAKEVVECSGGSIVFQEEVMGGVSIKFQGGAVINQLKILKEKRMPDTK